MDKQQAIDFVLDELDKGKPLPDITAALSSQLGAPVEIVSKFVTQTAQRYQQSKAALGHSIASNPLPSAFSAPLKGTPPPSSIPTYTSPPAMPEPIPSPNSVYQAPAVPEPFSVVQSPPVTEEQNVSAALQQAGSAVDADELEKFILSQLGGSKKESDIVMRVVEKTGMEYREAQRLVSRVGARNYKKVAAKQNCVIIPLALVFLVAGLILLGASVVEAYQIRFMLPSPNDLNIEQVQSIYERGRSLPWAFGAGLALSVGGAIGLFSAIRNQTR